MMATLLSKVQLLRDLKSLKAEAKVAEQKRQENLMQSNTKVRASFYSLFALCRPFETRQHFLGYQMCGLRARGGKFLVVTFVPDYTAC